MSKELYKRIDVVRRAPSGELVIYRCFELVQSGGFVVQSADRLRSPISGEQLGGHEQQWFDLLSQTAPELRSVPALTLVEAIAAFDREFGDEW